MKKYNAEEDIRLIKNILNKTQGDITSIGALYIWIGIINLLVEVVKNIGYIYINSLENISIYHWKILRFAEDASFFCICVLFLIYYIKICKKGNDISKSILKLWGILLIGGKIFTKVFLNIFSHTQQNFSEKSVLSLEKVFCFIFIIIGFVVLGVIVHDIKIIVGVSICILIYLFSLNINKTISIANIHGNSIAMYIQDIFLIMVMSLGMIICGGYIHKREIE